MAEDEKISLGPQEAVDLWKQGREVWNAWVAENPVADISFEGVDFRQYQSLETIPKTLWPFESFHFPIGTKNFLFTHYGYGITSFGNTRFRDGDVKFSKATFDGGALIFGGATFGEGDIFFYRTIFGSTNRGDGVIHFGNSNFGDGNVDLRELTLHNAQVDFKGATFNNGKVDFENTTFERGDVFFAGVTFGNADVSFKNTKFDTRIVVFDGAELGSGSYNFKNTVFKDRASFADLRNVHAAKSFSFRHASFGGAFTLSGNETFGCVPDLVGTKASHHISLAGLKCQFPTELNSSGYRRARDGGDAERLRRLKELAEQNRDFEAAIDFKVEEMHAARWRNKHGFTSVFVEGLFYLVSDYGRSLVRPIVGLGGVWVGFAMLYVIAGKRAFDCQAVGAGLSFSWGQMFIYVPTSKNAREEGMQALFSSPHSDWLFVATFSQSLLSLVLLFQVGLVLRNRFKL